MCESIVKVKIFFRIVIQMMRIRFMRVLLFWDQSQKLGKKGLKALKATASCAAL